MLIKFNKFRTYVKGKQLAVKEIPQCNCMSKKTFGVDIFS